VLSVARSRLSVDCSNWEVPVRDLTQPLFLSFLSFKNQKPDLSKLGSKTYTRKMNIPLFHNRICKVCSLVAATLILPTLAYADNNQGDDQGDGGIKPGVPNGTYAFQTSGYVSGTLIHSAGQLTFFANGNTTGLVSYSFGGTPFSRLMLKGTFTVNADGSVSLTVTIPAHNETFHFDLYPTPDGNTLTAVDSDLGTIVGGIWTRGR